jgi:high-affinity iron transporter
MLPIATVIFREVLEIALILVIVLAATRGLQGRMKLVALGLVLGALGSVIIAFFTDQISNLMQGMGQEIFNALIMFTAVFFLSWTVIWMQRHGKELAQDINKVGQDILSGEKSAYVLVAVIALASFREGAEIVLFTYGMAASDAYSLMAIITGGFLGAAAGITVGLMIYFGLLQSIKKHLFAVTSWMLIILTAGMAAQGANFLIAAGVLPEIKAALWDSSNILSAHGVLGEFLSVMIGYTPRPTATEFIFYVLTLSLISAGYFWANKRQKT